MCVRACVVVVCDMLMCAWLHLSTGILNYERDYGFFIRACACACVCVCVCAGTFNNLTSAPVVYAAIPPPLYKKSVYGMDQARQHRVCV